MVGIPQLDSLRKSPGAFFHSSYEKKNIFILKKNHPPPKNPEIRRGGMCIFEKIDLTFLFLEILIFSKSHMKCMRERRRMGYISASTAEKLIF